MDDGEDSLDFLNGNGGLVATVRISDRAMFWSEGRFQHGEAFEDHAEFFARVEDLSRRFQAHPGPDSARLVESLSNAWDELNERFTIRLRGSNEEIDDVGLHLDGPLASVRWV